MSLKIFVPLLFIGLLISAGCVSPGRGTQPEYCERVSLQDNKDQCYYSVATQLQSEELCEKVIDLNRKDRCFIDLAVGYRTYYWD